MISIRRYQQSDAKTLTDMFHETIHTVGLEHYSQIQLSAWAPYPIDYEHWETRLQDKSPWVAEIDGEIAGFMNLESDGLIRWAFTHKNHQRKGVAGALFAHIEKTAKNAGISRLSSEASYFAHPFFLKKGFQTIKENLVEIRGQKLTNFSVEKFI